MSKLGLGVEVRARSLLNCNCRRVCEFVTKLVPQLKEVETCIGKQEPKINNIIHAGLATVNSVPYWSNY